MSKKTERETALAPKLQRFADAANCRFIELARALDQVVHWRYPISPAPRRVEPELGKPAGTQPTRTQPTPPVEPEVLKSLAGLAQSALTRTRARTPARPEPPPQGSDRAGPWEPALRGLFHAEAGHRFWAAHEIRAAGWSAALGALESVLLIEEDPRVRAEISRAVHELCPNRHESRRDKHDSFLHAAHGGETTKEE